MQRLTYLLALWMLLCCLFEVSMAQDAGGDNSDSSGGDSSDDESNTNYWVYVHGILMSLGWVALLPLGALIAQNRWLQGFKTKIASREVWFVTHITIQAVGAALIIAAIGIAYSDSTGMEPEKDETVAYTHKIIGTIAFAFLLLQIAGGLVRPTPGTRFRGVWNHFHHNSGRLAILLAWVNIWLGVAIWQDGGDSGVTNGLLSWVVPLAVFQGLLLIAYLVGVFRKPKVVVATEPQKPLTDGRAQVHAAAPAGALQSTQV